MGGKIFIIGFGSIFLLAGLFVLISHIRRGLDCRERVKAEVIDLELSSSGDDGASYTAVYRYIYKEQEYTARSRISTSPPMHKIGDIVELRIDSSKPEKIFEQRNWVMYLFSALFIGIGAFIMYAGIMAEHE